MKAWTVASGVICDGDRVVFVQNRRRNGSLDWSPPGGVVDPGETSLEALQREVVEETALRVSSWSTQLYTVDVDFVDRDMTLHAEIWLAEGWRGSLAIDDPDGIVIDGRWVDPHEATELLVESPRWVAEPLQHTLGRMQASRRQANGPASLDELATMAWAYEVSLAGKRPEARLLRHPDG